MIVADCRSNQMINNIKSLDCLKAIWIQGHLYLVELLHGSKNESNNSRLGHFAASQACSKCRFYVSFSFAPGAKLNLNLKYWISHMVYTHFTCFIREIKGIYSVKTRFIAISRSSKSHGGAWRRQGLEGLGGAWRREGLG